MPNTPHDLVLTRRRLLQCAGGMLAAAAFPPSRAAAETPVGPIMATLSSFMSDAGSRALPDAVVEKTKHMILDTVAAMVSGSELPPGRFAIKFARAYRG